MARDGASPAWRRRASRRTDAPSRRAVIALLGAVLALQTADTAAIGAMAPDLEQALGISHAQIGLLASGSLLVAGLVTLPIGVVADRFSRPPMLAGSILLWSAALVASGAAASFGTLLWTRLALGGVTATAWPVVASLTGDLFPAAERARVFGVILCGELAGAGVGFLVSGNVAALLGWRAGFWVLVVPSLVLARAVWRHLPEPRHGAAAGEWPHPTPAARGATRRREPAPGAEPDLDRVLRESPATMPLHRVVRFVLGVRTNRLLIVASATGYLFVAGEQTFGVEFLRSRYGLGQSAATTLFVLLSAGALVGVLFGGRLADWLHAHGSATARPLVAGTSFIVCTAAFVVALCLPSLLMAAPAYLVAAATLEAPNPPLDAARLDVIPGGLWARAESVRTVLRNISQAAGPLIFGVLTDLLADVGAGIAVAFAVMLIPLLASGIVVLESRHSYARDTATAAAGAGGRAPAPRHRARR